MGRAYIGTGHKEASTIVQRRNNGGFRDGEKIREKVAPERLGMTQGSSVGRHWGCLAWSMDGGHWNSKHEVDLGSDKGFHLGHISWVLARGLAELHHHFLLKIYSDTSYCKSQQIQQLIIKHLLYANPCSRLCIRPLVLRTSYMQMSNFYIRSNDKVSIVSWIPKGRIHKINSGNRDWRRRLLGSEIQAGSWL